MGPAYTGKSLRGQIVDDAGSNVGSAITTATELTGGKGVFEQIATIPDGQTGFLRIYFSDAPTVFLASIPINPQEVENANAKTSDVVSAVAALPSASAIASAVWASGSRTLTSFGTLVADIWAYASRTLTSGAFSASSVWDYLTSSIATTGSIGKLLTDRIDAAVSSIAATATAQNPTPNKAGAITMQRGATFDATLTGLSIPVSWTSARLTVKRLSGDSDESAVLQILVSNPGAGGDGLQRVNGSTSGVIAANASLIVNQAGGTVAIHIEDDATILLAAGLYCYDCKIYYGTSDSMATAIAAWTVSGIVTAAV